MTYDELFEAIEEKYENGEYTYEQAEAMNKLAYEKYGIVEEGSNINSVITNETKNAINEFNSAIKEIRKCIKEEDYAKAKQISKSARKILNTLYSNMNKLLSSNADIAISQLKVYATLFGTLTAVDTIKGLKSGDSFDAKYIAKRGGHDAALAALGLGSADLARSQLEFSLEDKREALNYTKSLCKFHINLAKRILDHYDKKIESAETMKKMNKKNDKMLEKMKKESAMLDVYKAFDEGVFTEDEKELFLSILE